MSEAVQLAIVGVISSLITGTIVVGVSTWAYSRQKKTDADIQADLSDHEELAKVRLEDRQRIDKLEKRLDDRELEIRTLERALAAANATIARQAQKISDLEIELTALKQQHRGRNDGAGI